MVRISRGNREGLFFFFNYPWMMIEKGSVLSLTCLLGTSLSGVRMHLKPHPISYLIAHHPQLYLVGLQSIDQIC